MFYEEKHKDGDIWVRTIPRGRWRKLCGECAAKRLAIKRKSDE